MSTTMPRRERRKDTPEFKARVVKQVLEEGKSRAQVAKDGFRGLPERAADVAQ